MLTQNTISHPETRHGPAVPGSRPVSGMTGFEHRFETVHGTRLHYVIGGKADGDTIMLLAGYPESWYAWRKIMPILAKRYRIIAPDLPGQGGLVRGYIDTQGAAL